MQNKTDPSEFITAAEVSAICCCPLSTVYYWVTHGKLRAYKPGRRVLFRRREVLDWIERAATTVIE